MRVLVAAHDAGSANAVAPVVPLLIGGGAAVDALASGPAVAVFQRHGIAHIAYAPPDSIQGYMALARAAFAAEQPDAVLTGSSWGASLDKAAVAVAREMGVVSVTVLDMWSYYRERFVDAGSGELRYLPDRLAVMDDLALRATAAASQRSEWW